jgi:hypothetical protein
VQESREYYSSPKHRWNVVNPEYLEKSDVQLRLIVYPSTSIWMNHAVLKVLER